MAGHFPLYFRNFIFGVEDSLVSTVGLLAGIAIGGVSRETIFLTGAVVILVEAFSMAAGSFLVESSMEEYTHKKDRSERPIWGGMVMFVSYMFAGFIPLAPYIFFVEDSTALYMSALTSLIALFILGLVGGSLSHVNILRRGVRMMLVGSIAVVAGVVAGLAFAISRF